MFVCVCVVFRTCAAFWSMLSQLFIVYNTIELHIFNCNEVLTSQIHEKNELRSLSVMLFMLLRLVYLLKCSNKGSGAVAGRHRAPIRDEWDANRYIYTVPIEQWKGKHFKADKKQFLKYLLNI